MRAVLKQYTNGRWTAYVQFEGHSETIHNFAEREAAECYIMSRISSEILKFCRHRKAAYIKTGTYYKSREAVIKLLMYKAEGYRHWQYSNLTHIIAGMYHDLVYLLPPHTSKHHKFWSERIYEIVKWEHGR